LTKLLWHNMYDPPCITPQSQVIARMFLLGNMVIHWLHQLCTAKLDLDSYPSLRHFRNAANKRSSFHNTLLKMVHAIKNRSLPSIVRSPSPPITEGVLTRRNDTRTRLGTWGTTTTGATPKCNVKKWYSTIPSNPAEGLLHARTKECIGVPVYRVDPKTKGNKAAGSRGHCVECHRLTPLFLHCM
jgi:hypothetical protein